MATWLLKTEPNDYSYDDLVRDGSTIWDGVSNPTACIHIRKIKKGDWALIYHTGSEKRIAGLARVVSDHYEDPKSPGLTAKGDIKRPVVDLEAHKGASKALTLSDIKGDPSFEHPDFELATNARLSAMPVPAPIAKLIRSRAGL